MPVAYSFGCKTVNTVEMEVHWLSYRIVVWSNTYYTPCHQSKRPASILYVTLTMSNVSLWFLASNNLKIITKLPIQLLSHSPHLTLQNDMFAILAYCIVMLNGTKCYKTAVAFKFIKVRSTWWQIVSKVVPYSITSVGHGADHGFLAVSTQVT